MKEKYITPLIMKNVFFYFLFLDEVWDIKTLVIACL